jgi:hypothetical protein
MVNALGTLSRVASANDERIKDTAAAKITQPSFHVIASSLVLVHHPVAWPRPKTGSSYLRWHSSASLSPRNMTKNTLVVPPSLSISISGLEGSPSRSDQWLFQKAGTR